MICKENLNEGGHHWSRNIGSNIGRRAAEAGHDVVFSFSRDPGSLARLAADVVLAPRVELRATLPLVRLLFWRLPGT